MNMNKPRTRKRPSIHVDCHVAKPSIEEQLKDLDSRDPIDRFVMTAIDDGVSIDRKTAIALVDAICDVVTEDLKATGYSKSPLGIMSFEQYIYNCYFRFKPDDDVWMTALTRTNDESTTRFATRVRDKIRSTADIETADVSRLISMYLLCIYDLVTVGAKERCCMIGTSEETKLGDACIEATPDGLHRITIRPSPNLLNAVTGTGQHKEPATNSEDSDEFCPWPNSFRFEKIVLDYVIEHLARNGMSWAPIGKVVWLKSYHHKRAITTESCYIDMVNDGYIANPMFSSLRDLIVPMYDSDEKHVESLMNAYATAIRRWWDKHDIAPIDRIGWLVDRWKYVNDRIHGKEDDE